MSSQTLRRNKALLTDGSVQQVDTLSAHEFLELLAVTDDFIEKEVDLAWDDIERTDTIPDSIRQGAADIGLFGLTIPVEYGGIGLHTFGKTLVETHLGRSSYGFATLVGNHTGISSAGIVELGDEEQRQRYLPKMARGDLIGAFALTEPGAGSDAAAVATRADRVSGGWRIDGEKIFITNAAEAGVFTVIAATDPEKGASGLSAFLVDRGSEGLEIGRNEAKMGMRGAHTCPLVFRDCFVPDGQLLGREGDGLRSALHILTRGRAALAGRCIGVADRAFDLAREHAMNRHQFGRRIIDNQGIQWMLADMATQTEAAWSLVVRAARTVGSATEVAEHVSMAKLFATEALDFVVDRAVQIHGGAGYISDYRVERLYRDARITRIYEGSSEIQRTIIARALMR